MPAMEGGTAEDLNGTRQDDVGSVIETERVTTAFGAPTDMIGTTREADILSVVGGDIPEINP
jgi:hypothetical protein